MAGGRGETGRVQREGAATTRGEYSHLTSDNEELTREIQSVLDESETETNDKLSKYDILKSTEFVQLQTNSSYFIEKELQPLREAERAAILMENATIREGSQTQSYTKLKQEHKELKKCCEDLQAH